MRRSSSHRPTGNWGSCEVRRLDLADLASVRAFVNAWQCDSNVLINNAGVIRTPKRRTAGGFELQSSTPSAVKTNARQPSRMKERWRVSQLDLAQSGVTWERSGAGDSVCGATLCDSRQEANMELTC
jgi:hypothetical protein